MNAKQARALLRYWHENAMPVFDVSARGRVYRVAAISPHGAILEGMKLYAAEFGARVDASFWTVRKLTHTKG